MLRLLQSSLLLSLLSWPGSGQNIITQPDFAVQNPALCPHVSGEIDCRSYSPLCNAFTGIVEVNPRLESVCDDGQASCTGTTGCGAAAPARGTCSRRRCRAWRTSPRAWTRAAMTRCATWPCSPPATAFWSRVLKIHSVFQWSCVPVLNITLVWF